MNRLENGRVSFPVPSKQAARCDYQISAGGMTECDGGLKKKHRCKLSAPVVLCDFTLANKHAGAPNGHFAWLGRNRDHTYLESGVCRVQHCQLPSITPQTYENLRIKSETVMAASSWAPLARVYVQIILMPCLLSPNWTAAKQSQSLCWDTREWTKKTPTYLHSALPDGKVVFLINWSGFSVRPLTVRVRGGDGHKVFILDTIALIPLLDNSVIWMWLSLYIYLFIFVTWL